MGPWVMIPETWYKRMIVIADWHKMAEVADFDPRYLHVGARQNEVGEG